MHFLRHASQPPAVDRTRGGTIVEVRAAEYVTRRNSFNLHLFSLFVHMLILRIRIFFFSSLLDIAGGKDDIMS
jgi:hypothetical protein